MSHFKDPTITLIRPWENTHVSNKLYISAPPSLTHQSNQLLTRPFAGQNQSHHIYLILVRHAFHHNMSLQQSSLSFSPNH